MYAHNLPMHLVRALAPSRLAAGLLVTVALLSAACSDPTSQIDSAPLLHRSGNGPSAAASNFAVLAGTAVTCTNSTVDGDVGVYPGTAVTRTNCTIDGTVHAGDGVAKQAVQDFLTEYDRLEAVKCDEVLTTLDGLFLSPGVYCFDAAATSTGGVLTLTGPSNGTWLFKIGTLGTGALTGTNFSVVMEGGGQACNVTWWVAEAATLTDSDFLGTILAGAAITITGGTFEGNAFAQAAVTLTRADVTGCEGSKGHDRGKGKDKDKDKCNQGVGNGREGCDPGNSNHRHSSNDEDGGSRGNPGRKGGH